MLNDLLLLLNAANDPLPPPHYATDLEYARDVDGLEQRGRRSNVLGDSLFVDSLNSDSIYNTLKWLRLNEVVMTHNGRLRVEDRGKAEQLRQFLWEILERV